LFRAKLLDFFSFLERPAWHRGVVRAIMKKGSQQRMKAPVTMARVFAAFFSLFVSRDTCFFSFFLLREGKSYRLISSESPESSMIG